jgi:FKBP-type peptidyl-prolyl cis-trans isomerase
MLRLLLAAALVAPPALAQTRPPPRPAARSAPRVAAPARPVGQVRLPQLSYTIHASGPTTGALAQRRDIVTVDYTLTLLDGTVVDSSVARGQPATFPLNGLIPAWQILIPLMRPGDDWTFYVPPEYGYGPRASERLPANSFLVFRVKLIATQPSE